MRPLSLFAAVPVLLIAAPAEAMSVADFLPKAEALNAKGMMAMFSSDLKPVMTTAQNATRAWRAQVAPPGAKRNACPPEKLKMSPDDFLGLLRAVPPAQRARTTVTQATVMALNRRYPCAG